MEVVKMIRKAFSDHFLKIFNISPKTYGPEHEKMSIQTKYDILKKTLQWKE